MVTREEAIQSTDTFQGRRWRCTICGSGWRVTERHTPECTLSLAPNGPELFDRGWTRTVNLARPLLWHEPATIALVNEDLFDGTNSTADIAAVFGIMGACPQHTFLVLTLNPENASRFFKRLDRLDPDSSDRWTDCHTEALLRDDDNETVHTRSDEAPGRPWPLPNVYLGVRVEDQAEADERIPLLLQCPAAVRWVAAVGHIDLSKFMWPLCESWPSEYTSAAAARAAKAEVTLERQRLVSADKTFLDWVVVEPEHGERLRLDWLRATVAKCRAANVPLWVLSLGTDPLGARTGFDEWPEDIRVRERPPTSGAT